MKNLFVVDATCDAFTFCEIEDVYVECFTDEGLAFAEEYNDLPEDKDVTHAVSVKTLLDFYLKHHPSIPLASQTLFNNDDSDIHLVSAKEP
jgi:hypothetical protein